jgi:hypothetical protein
MEFPMLVYKDGGPHQRKGGTFDYKPVRDEQQLDAALDQGWHESLLDAIEAPKPLAQAPQVPQTAPRSTDSTRRPTREELEQKATELGIPFGPRVSDRKLGEAIAAKLAGQ